MGNFPPQSQSQKPGLETLMQPKPLVKGSWYKGSGKLKNKVALITGGDSGIGRSVAIFFAREGANIAISYLNEDEDAEDTRKMIEDEGASCLIIRGDLSESKNCDEAVERAIKRFGRLDILVNNAAYQHSQKDLEGLKDSELEKTFKTNIFSYIYMARAALKYLPERTGVIINTTSITAFKGSARLLDYSATKGAILGFTRSLSLSLMQKGIRVNAVAPGPIWTPLTPSTFSPEEVAEFGSKTPMKRAGQPEEVTPTFVFLASQDSSYISGQTIHPNGGEPVTS
ncbi:MAG TPA: SDR family oxidoreductase [Candidatus Omnitrophota bacterium]|nr:SDR family oxidoreductase [Candidatus Omnitrophota bacterium]